LSFLHGDKGKDIVDILFDEAGHRVALVVGMFDETKQKMLMSLADVGKSPHPGDLMAY
jgi:hypothetical protein